MELSAYALEALHEDGEFILYRGRHRRHTDASPSSLLLLAPVAPRPARGTLAKIEHEYSLREELAPTWAARPLALAHHSGQPVLVLEDPGGEPLDRLIQGPMELGPCLRLAGSLAGALRELHTRHLIHKDIKPANVLVDARTGHVRLMGFGIASRLTRERQQPDPPEVIAGTLAYMAPEQTGRMNRSIDSRSDLYACGVTFYEMLIGSLPFTASEVSGGSGVPCS
jgi:serine/threonine protein kinase